MKSRNLKQHIVSAIVALSFLLGGPFHAAAASAGQQSGAWLGEYYANSDLVGGPVLTREDPEIDFDWGLGAPADGIPEDGFSVRWTRTVTFSEGLYLFRATVDDGIRVYVDGRLLIDEWTAGGRREVTAERRMSAGSHALRVEYTERDGAAVVRLGWEDVSPWTSSWKGEYWTNMDLKGGAALVRTDPVLAFDWKQESPAPSIPSDSFSARWTRWAPFEAGTYRFHVLVDDGVRLWVDDRLILDAWSDHDAAELTRDHALTEGTHALKVEYYERIGNARIWVWWEEVTAAAYPQWKGEYWNNPSLSGDPTLVRNDRDVNFDWGQGPPSPSLPADNFSARWTREVPLESSVYRFHVSADDGARLWVDGQLRYEAWYDQSAEDETLDLSVTKGQHEIVVEYYEHGGDARVHVWWERLSGPVYPDWKGEYWANRDLSGTPALVRDDPRVSFAWGTEGPAAR
jgi:single-stranded DNA-binding protein